MRRLLEWITAPRQVSRLFEPFFRIRGYRKAQPGTLQQARRVLIVRPDHLGDVILTSAFLREFRKSWPEAKITLLVDPESESLVKFCPYVDHIEVYSRFKTGPFGRIRRFFREANWARRHLWPQHFELAIVPRWDTQIFREAFLAYLSGAKWRVGFSEEGNTIARSEEPQEVLYTHLAPSGAAGHDVQQSLNLLRFMGGTVAETRTEVWPDPAARGVADSFLPDPPEPVVRVAMVPGSSSVSRRWPAERFGEIAGWMSKELGWQVVLVGSPKEAPLGEIVEKASPQVVNLIGRTTVPQTIAVVGKCQLYVGNDTGPMHIASALGVPVVEISCHPANGSPSHERSPSRFGAWDVPTWIAQPATGVDECREFCIRGERGEAHCVLAIGVDQLKGLVLEAAKSCGLSTGA